MQLVVDQVKHTCVARPPPPAPSQGQARRRKQMLKLMPPPLQAQTKLNCRNSPGTSSSSCTRRGGGRRSNSSPSSSQGAGEGVALLVRDCASWPAAIRELSRVWLQLRRRGLPPLRPAKRQPHRRRRHLRSPLPLSPLPDRLLAVGEPPPPAGAGQGHQRAAAASPSPSAATVTARSPLRCRPRRPSSPPLHRPSDLLSVALLLRQLLAAPPAPPCVAASPRRRPPHSSLRDGSHQRRRPSHQPSSPRRSFPVSCRPRQPSSTLRRRRCRHPRPEEKGEKGREEGKKRKGGDVVYLTCGAYIGPTLSQPPREIKPGLKPPRDLL
ncbi:hypothetical protein DAI22_08g193100 [Oryza sativa Japonica Group]|nr:hypothetical protein DAI22_08g193100 [Oryza sativa Japonica Group]